MKGKGRLLAVFVAAVLAVGQAQGEIRLVSSACRSWVDISKVAAQGDYAYLTTAGGLEIVDLSDPENPVQVGHCDIPGAGYIEVRGDYVYLNNRITYSEQYFHIIDVSDPANPTIVYSHRYPHMSNSFTVSGDLAFLTSLYDDYGNPPPYDPFLFTILDISNHNSPHVEYSVGEQSLGWDNYRANGQFLHYFNANTGFINTLDISDPSDPIWYGEMGDWSRDCYWLALDDHYLYAAGDILAINDITDIQNQNLVFRTDTVSGVKNIQIVDSMLYLTRGDTLTVLDVGDQSQPEWVCDYVFQTPQKYIYVNDRWILGNDAQANLNILDNSDSANPRFISTLNGSGAVWAADVDSSLIYAADGVKGVRILDWSDPANPEEMGACEMEGKSAVFISQDNGYAVVANADSGWTLVDVSDPTAPEITATITPGESIQKAYCRGDYAIFIQTRYQQTPQLLIYNIQDKGNPFLVSAIDKGSDFSIDGDRMFVAVGTKIVLYDIQQPAFPNLIKEFTFGDYARGVAGISAGYDRLFCMVEYMWGFEQETFYYKTLWGLDLRDLANPDTIVRAKSETYIRLQGVSGQIVAITDTDLRFYSYAEDRQLTLVESLSDMNQLKGLVFAGNYGILSNYSYLGIYDLSDVLSAPPAVSYQPSAFGLSSFPNPFNATAVVGYRLSVVGKVSLRLYDIAGRLALTVAEGVQAAGEHRVTIDGSLLASGVYLARLEAAGRSDVKKLVCVK